MTIVEDWGDDIEIIVQANENNEALLPALTRRKGVSFLFDESGGAGRSPERWPLALESNRCGYAGGLGPDNLEREIGAIELAAQCSDTWVDMEGKLRDGNDEFCLATCARIGQIARQYEIRARSELAETLSQPKRPRP